MRLLYCILTILISCHLSGQEYFLLVGTYDSPKSEGIYVYRFNTKNGDSKAVSQIKLSNASYITVSPDEKFVYSVNENGKNASGGKVSSFSFDKTTGGLIFINSEFSGGDHPCYIETDKSGKWVFAGNYSTGNLAVFPVSENGGLNPADTIIQHTGISINKQRQNGPHVHCTVISPDNNWLLVPDLGIDKAMIYSFDNINGSLSTGKQPFISSEPGAGPRHLVFHPFKKTVYLIEELSGTISVHHFKNGKTKNIQRISTMITDDSSFAGSADIHVSADGKFLYASNRGNVNNIAIFSIEKKGRLSLIGHQSVLGKTPRHFNFDPTGKYLLACNQNSDEIVIFQRDINSGLLTDTGKRIQVGRPVCLKWIKIN